MARHIGPKTRLARRVGAALLPKDEKILTKRNFRPGMHGQKRIRVSQYGQQLLEKQKAKWTYGIFEKQFRNYYERAAAAKGMTGELLIQYLEKRLDNVVFRLGFAATRPQARQLVSHGFFQVNGKKVNIPSYEVSIGDVIKVKESKVKSKYMITQKALMAQVQTPEWLSLNSKEMSGKVTSFPTAELSGASIQTQLIVELYSR